MISMTKLGKKNETQLEVIEYAGPKLISHVNPKSATAGMLHKIRC